jgi:hypothetical protein
MMARALQFEGWQARRLARGGKAQLSRRLTEQQALRNGQQGDG